MGKLSETVKANVTKWKAISNGKKVAYASLFIGLIIIIIYLGMYTNGNNYAVLFSNLDANDSKTVTASLEEKKITWKANGNTILVPKGDVDKLRLDLAPTITNGSKGFELLDTSKFGATEQEMNIEYQRALQGELERTIKSFPQIESARVHIVPSESSVFVKDSTSGSASVTLKMKIGQKLSNDQVRAIVALMTGSIKNLPKENVQVIDGNMTLLTKGIFDKDNPDATFSTEKQQNAKLEVEKELESKISKVLEPAYKDVRVSVNADLNFDAVQNNSTKYGTTGTIESQHRIIDSSGGTTIIPSQSPVDQNMNNTIAPTKTPTTNVNHIEETNNVAVDKSETKTIKAPGEIKKVTTSILLNGNLDEAARSKIKNLVISAIAYDEKRGDNISIEGLVFDTALQDKTKKDLVDMQKTTDNEKKMALYKLIGEVVGGVLLLALIIFLIKKRKGEDVDIEHKGIDVLIDDNMVKPNPIHYKPIDFEVNDEKSHIESEIKKYATDKPDQVADIVKSWLAEDER